MKSIYQLQIHFDASIETFESVSALLGIKPEIQDHFLGKIPCDWVYKVVQEDDDIYFDFINEFLNILENNYEKLLEIGIRREEITIWYLYEYDQQCNMEFDPIRLKRLGDNGLTLCISCWDASEH